MGYINGFTLAILEGVYMDGMFSINWCVFDFIN